MTTAAVMMVKDEADVIEATVRHLVLHVDRIYALDNGSADDTPNILRRLEWDGFPLELFYDDTIAYEQSRRTTELALFARTDGHSWVVPCDADEVWHPSHEPDRRISDYLSGLSPDVLICEARLFDHFPTGGDGEGHPFHRMGWRNQHHSGLPKVAVRTEGLVRIEMGNHGAVHEEHGAVAGGLTVHHFSWRSEDQYLRKIRNGREAYAATDMDEAVGAHWRMFAGADDDAIREHYRRWFFKPNALESDPPLTYDPAPVMGW